MKETRKGATGGLRPQTSYARQQAAAEAAVQEVNRRNVRYGLHTSAHYRYWSLREVCCGPHAVGWQLEI